MPSPKKRKLSDDMESPALHDSEVPSSESEADISASSDTEHGIAQAHYQKSKKSQKRKFRATSPSRFGGTLQSLLSTDVPSTVPLSLKPSVGRQRNEEKLDRKAKKAVEVLRKEQEDQRRIKGVIGGWGGESERGLRKIAQRGVVKLFNVIQGAQNAASADADVIKANRGTGKPSLTAPLIRDRRTKSHTKSDALEKVDFLEAIRLGGIVPKA